MAARADDRLALIDQLRFAAWQRAETIGELATRALPAEPKAAASLLRDLKAAAVEIQTLAEAARVLIAHPELPG